MSEIKTACGIGNDAAGGNKSLRRRTGRSRRAAGGGANKRGKKLLAAAAAIIMLFIMFTSEDFSFGKLSKDTGEAAQQNADTGSGTDRSEGESGTAAEASSKNEAADKDASKGDANGEKHTAAGEPAVDGSQGTKADKPLKHAVKVEDIYKKDGKKKAFLTFDDGPHPHTTPEVLKILDKYGIKATFFVIGSQAEKHSDLIKKQAEGGHSIGNHTYSHKYDMVYASVDSFIQEVDRADKVLKGILGPEFKTRLFRFPAGSFENYKQPMKAALNQHGYQYIDWNALNGDEEVKNPSVERLISRLKETVGEKENIVVLMHDSAYKKNMLEALPVIIEYLIEKGYDFNMMI